MISTPPSSKLTKGQSKDWAEVGQIWVPELLPAPRCCPTSCSWSWDGVCPFPRNHRRYWENALCPCAIWHLQLWLNQYYNMHIPKEAAGNSFSQLRCLRGVIPNDQGQLGDLRPPLVLRELPHVLQPTVSLQTGCTVVKTLPDMSQDYFIFPWSCHPANSLPLRSNKFRVSQRFASVWRASAAGSGNRQTWINSPAGGWALSPLTCTIGTCVCIRKICTELSLLLWNSRWCLPIAVRQLWSPGAWLNWEFLIQALVRSQELAVLTLPNPWRCSNRQSVFQGTSSPLVHLPTQWLAWENDLRWSICFVQLPNRLQQAGNLWQTSEWRNFHTCLAAPLPYRWMGFNSRCLSALKSWI